MLIALIDDQALDETQILLPGALIVRESSGGQRGWGGDAQLEKRRTQI